MVICSRVVLRSTVSLLVVLLSPSSRPLWWCCFSSLFFVWCGFPPRPLWVVLLLPLLWCGASCGGNCMRLRLRHLLMYRLMRVRGHFRFQGSAYVFRFPRVVDPFATFFGLLVLWCRASRTCRDGSEKYHRFLSRMWNSQLRAPTWLAGFKKTNARRQVAASPLHCVACDGSTEVAARRPHDETHIRSWKTQRVKPLSHTTPQHYASTW